MHWEDDARPKLDADTTDDASDTCEAVLVRALDHAVGGSDGCLSRARIWALCRARVSDDVVSLTERPSGCALDAGLIDPSELADVRLESTKDDTRFVSGDGASSSSLSLQPSPVVRPMPPLNKVPSRCLTRLLAVSR